MKFGKWICVWVTLTLLKAVQTFWASASPYGCVPSMLLMSSWAVRMICWNPSIIGCNYAISIYITRLRRHRLTWNGLLWRFAMAVSPVWMDETTGWSCIESWVIWLMLVTICAAVKARFSMAAPATRLVNAIKGRRVLRNCMMIWGFVESEDRGCVWELIVFVEASCYSLKDAVLTYIENWRRPFDEVTQLERRYPLVLLPAES